MAAKKKPAQKTAPSKKARSVKSTAKPKRAKAQPPTIAQFMTSSVHTIGRDQSLALAHQLMTKHRIRHLPVLDVGELVGVVSERDLYFVESLGDTPPAEIRVEEAMSPDVFVTSRDASLADVANTMIQKKLGCTIVTRNNQVVGVFSIIDGLKALLKYLPA